MRAHDDVARTLSLLLRNARGDTLALRIALLSNVNFNTGWAAGTRLLLLATAARILFLTEFAHINIQNTSIRLGGLMCLVMSHSITKLETMEDKPIIR